MRTSGTAPAGPNDQVSILAGTPPLRIVVSRTDISVEARDTLQLGLVLVLFVGLSVGFSLVLAFRLSAVVAIAIGACGATFISGIGLAVSYYQRMSYRRDGPFLKASMQTGAVEVPRAGICAPLDDVRNVQWSQGVIQSSPYHNHYEPRSYVFICMNGDTDHRTVVVCVNPRVRGGADRVSKALAEFFDKPRQRLPIEKAVRIAAGGYLNCSSHEQLS